MQSVSSEIAVVVLNWNGADDTLECLASLRRSTLPVYVVVVDNGSTDDSLDRIRASGLADDVVATGENLGYAEGNNVGLRRALDRGAEFVAVLNNDTVVERDALGALREHLLAAGSRAVAPDIRYFANPAISWFAGGVIERGWTRHLQPDELPRDGGPLRPSEWLSGCCIAARRETWRRVGLFDAGYFILFEDSDWSLRAVAAGVGLYVATDSVIMHKVSRTFSQGLPLSVLGGFYFVRNGLTFVSRHFRADLARFAFIWLVRPAPGLLRKGRWRELGFRWMGAAAFALRLRGRAPRVLERLAARLAG